MDKPDSSIFARAMATVETFSEKHVAVLPEKANIELLKYLAAITGQDLQKIERLYDLIIAAARLDKYTEGTFSGTVGFAEEEGEKDENKG